MNHDFLVKLLVLLTLGSGLTGCDRDEIKVYTIPKEQPSPATHADHAAAHAAPQLQWQLPAGWKEGSPSEFRMASFRIKGADGKEADVSVVPLPGGAGGDLSNVNRWRGQVSQPPVSDEELKKLAQPIALAGQPAQLYEQSGEGPTGEPTRILAAIQHRAGMAWFFKMTGDDKLVAQQKPVFVEFLKSIQFTRTESAPQMPSSPTASAGKPQWTLPADWEEVAGGQFLVAKFVITGTGDVQAAVNVSSSAGNGGGLAANVNRWRKQLGLPELTGEELTKTAVTRGGATFVEMTGTDARSGQPAALVGAMVLQPGQVWFYKLMGNATVVAAQKEAFSKFVQEVRY